MYPVKIIRVITWLTHGGIEKKIVDVLSRLNRKKFTPIVCCLRKKKGVYEDELYKKRIKVYKLDFKSRLDHPEMFKLANLLKRERVKILHSHMYRANIPSIIAGRCAHVPVIVPQIHNIESWKGKRQFLLERLLYPLSTKILTVSDAVKKFESERTGLPLNKFLTLYNGVDLEEFRYSDIEKEKLRKELAVSGKKIVGMVARLYPQKGHIYLLRAAKRIIHQIPEVSFLIVGDGPLRTYLEKTVAEFGLGNHVIFTGSVRNPRPFYSLMDISVLSSKIEGFSNVILESMASGIPVVATRVGGNPEAIVDNQNGFLVPYGEVEPLAQKITILLRDEQLVKRMGQKAREMASLFSLEKMVEKTEELYDKLLAQ